MFGTCVLSGPPGRLCVNEPPAPRKTGDCSRGSPVAASRVRACGTTRNALPGTSMMAPAMPRFRHKALAALLAAVTGALGLNRVYLGQGLWWLPLGVTLGALPLLIGVRNWYQTPAFFVAMVPVIAGFIQALVLALMPDEKFDARFNANTARRNRSGWDAVLVAIASLAAGTIILTATIALLFQTYFESVLRPAG